MRLRNGTFLTLLLFCLCAFLSLSWYAALSGQKGEPPPQPPLSPGCGPAPAPHLGAPGRRWPSGVRVRAARGGRKPTRAPLPRLGSAGGRPSPPRPHLFAAGITKFSTGLGRAKGPIAGHCPVWRLGTGLRRTVIPNARGGRSH
jgi:hypothetical protein